ncbi:MAG TPA: hypothetical protein VEU33_05920 [Archangium sp.]|nr:hypothetical protein [Archangium sp.]
MRFPFLARTALALGTVSGPVAFAGTMLVLGAAAASLLNRLLNGKAAQCPDCAFPLVPGTCSKGPCLTCAECGGCFDEQARRTIVAVEEVGSSYQAGDPCPDCVGGKLESAVEAETGRASLMCLDCSDVEEPAEASAPANSTVVEPEVSTLPSATEVVLEDAARVEALAPATENENG